MYKLNTYSLDRRGQISGSTAEPLRRGHSKQIIEDQLKCNDGLYNSEFLIEDQLKCQDGLSN